MIDPVLTDIILAVLAHDILRYVLGAGGVFLLVNVALARRLRARKIRRDSPGWHQIATETAVSLRTVAVFAVTGTVIAAAAHGGLVPIYDDIATRGWGWFAASIALIVLAHDTWFYWSHWLMHRPRLFRLLHRRHHRSHNPTPFTSYSFDTAEALIHTAFLPAFVAMVPMHPAALLVFLLHMMLRNAVGHCGYELFPAARDGRPLFDWMTTVTHHDLHHAHPGHNLGLYFTWWDRIMGTEHPRYRAEFARVATVMPVRSSPAAKEN